MNLEVMTRDEYEFWSARAKKAYAEDKLKANRLSQQEAEEIATRDFLRLLPDGAASKNSFLYALKHPEDGTVGFLWFGLQGAKDNKKAFVYDIVIEEIHRGKGYGKMAMLLLEDEVKRLGLTEIGLHVFGFNKTAIRMYQSLGYQTTDLVMMKALQ